MLVPKQRMKKTGISTSASSYPVFTIPEVKASRDTPQGSHSVRKHHRALSPPNDSSGMNGFQCPFSPSHCRRGCQPAGCASDAPSLKNRSAENERPRKLSTCIQKTRGHSARPRIWSRMRRHLPSAKQPLSLKHLRTKTIPMPALSEVSRTAVIK